MASGNLSGAPHPRACMPCAYMPCACMLCMLCLWLPACAATPAQEKTEPAAVFANYALERNPRPLLARCAMEKPLTQADEHAFLTTLRQQSPANLRTLFLVVGGFTDGVSGYAYSIVKNLPDRITQSCDVFYREHDEGGGVRALLRIYAAAGKPIILVGHSWGGSCAVLDGADQVDAPIALLVTLDPVGRRKPVTKPKSVRTWRNIYVAYATAPLLNVSNTAARIGSPWEATPGATSNRVSETGIHDDPLGMFQRYAQQEVLTLLHGLDDRNATRP